MTKGLHAKPPPTQGESAEELAAARLPAQEPPASWPVDESGRDGKIAASDGKGSIWRWRWTGQLVASPSLSRTVGMPSQRVIIVLPVRRRVGDGIAEKIRLALWQVDLQTHVTRKTLPGEQQVPATRRLRDAKGVEFSADPSSSGRGLGFGKTRIRPIWPVDHVAAEQHRAGRPRPRKLTLDIIGVPFEAGDLGYSAEAERAGRPTQKGD